MVDWLSNSGPPTIVPIFIILLNNHVYIQVSWWIVCFNITFFINHGSTPVGWHFLCCMFCCCLESTTNLVQLDGVLFVGCIIYISGWRTLIKLQGGVVWCWSMCCIIICCCFYYSVDWNYKNFNKLPIVPCKRMGKYVLQYGIILVVFHSS